MLLAGCSKEPGVPLFFHLSDGNMAQTVAVPTNSPSLVVSNLQMVGVEPAQGRVTVRLFPQDAGAFERLTEENQGKTLILVQGTNILAAPKIVGRIPAQAGIMIPISTNADFGGTVQELLKLRQQP